MGTSFSNRILHCPVVLLLLLLSFVLLASKPAAAQSVSVQDFNTFPVTRYSQPRADRTGNNNYFGIASPSDGSNALVTSSGAEDLLLYSDPTFRTLRLDDLYYYQSADWYPNNQSALLVGSTTPPDTGGVIVRYEADGSQLTVLSNPGPNLMGTAINADGNPLIVGGGLVPDHRGVVYRYENNDLVQLRSVNEAVLHDVAWNPAGSQALIVGERGTVLTWSPDNNNFSQRQLPHRNLLQAVDWHPDESKALIGGDEGLLYLYDSGELIHVTTDFDWSIKDIHWHPTENHALLVGGTAQDEQGYWGIYEQFRTETIPLSKPLFSGRWIDEDNALIGGQKVLWRISRDRSREDFGLNASLSVNNPTPETGEPLTLTGFGSTYQANADSVAAYQFHFGTGQSTSWQNNPNHSLEYLGSGRYEAKVDVRTPYTDSVKSATRTIRVASTGTAGAGRGIDFYYWFTFLIFLASLGVAYVALKV